MLVGIHEQTVRTHTAEEDSLEKLVLIYIEYILFLWHAGLSERAITALRCQLEFNLFCPEQMSSAPLQARKSFFEVFYSSGCDKLGQDDAIGWKNWLIKQHDPAKSISPWHRQDIVNPMEIFPEDKPECSFEVLLKSLVASGCSREEAWMRMEEWRSKYELDAVSQDADVEDVERMVLLDDFSFSLFSLGADEEYMFQLCLLYLLILGVPTQTQNAKV
jgi:hypothetical protein